MKATLKSLCKDGYKNHIVALTAGAAVPLGFAPWNLWPIILIALPVFLLTIHDASKKTAIRRSWFFGFGLYGVGVSWVYVSIATYGYTPPVLAIPLTFIFTGGLALLMMLQTAFWKKFNTAQWYVLAFPACWVLFEWFRSWFLTGFPWLYLGYGYIDTPLAGYAPVLGVYGLSFFIVLTSTALFSAVYSADYKWLLVCALIWSGGFALQQVQWIHEGDKKLSVALVQGDIPQDLKWQIEMREVTMDIYQGLTHSYWDKDIIIWPEAGIPMFFDESESFIDSTLGKTSTKQNVFISGIPYRQVIQQKPYYYNSIMAVAGSHEKLPLHFYHKQKMVPFGEYIPLEGLLRGLIPFFDLPMSSFSAGQSSQQGLMAGNYRVGALICYEVVYPDFVKNTAAESDFFVTISNDAWFGSSHGPNQHFQMARMRALEHGKYLLRATNTGITAIVDPRGKVIKQLASFEAGVLEGELSITRGITPFSVFGSVPILGFCFLIWLISYLMQRKATAAE